MLPLNDFLEYGKKNALFTPQDKILLAVSGGKDSVLMAHLFHEAEIPFAIAHCNFQLRGEESQRDAEFVENLAKKFNVRYFIQRFETSVYADHQKISTQLAARELRYQWFDELRLQHNFNAIATAHHQNDVTETLLFNLSRGAGLTGLHGILPKKDHIIRPILFLNTLKINHLIAKNSIDFVEDSSNQSTYYSRNKIRQICIPALEQINPETVPNMAKTAEKMYEYELLVQDFLQLKKTEWMDQSDKNITKIFPEKFKNLKYAQTISYELLKDFEFKAAQIPSILKEDSTGAKFESSLYSLIVNRKEWHIQSLALKYTESETTEIQEHQTLVLFGSKTITICLSNQIQISKHPFKVHLDADNIVFPLKIRTWQHGDQIKPLGMNGIKNISDIFIDTKTPIYEKNKIPILVNGDGKIIWLMGKTINDDFKITNNTKKILILDAQ